MQIALIGYGYWGHKIYKTLSKIISSKNISVVDININDSTGKLKIESIINILSDDKINHVIIATPEETHYKIAKICLENSKNVFVEKPLCLKKNEAIELHQLANKKNLGLYVDYIFLFDPYVRKIKSIIDRGTLGRLLHIKSIRHSININKPNITVFDDLATHDIYLGKFFFENYCKKFATLNESVQEAQVNQVNQASIVFYYGKNTLSANYSWVQPTSKRVMTFIGDLTTLVWDKNMKSLYLYKKQKRIKKIEIKSSDSALELSIKEFLFNKPKSNYANDVELLENINANS
ncbi:MAG: Gfo/Idh/MocA family oxidoreductase [Pseudomonadales bacterium]|nr:Gfo/Idh/MocA family oxidoreductase [Pseudomonadales bacterium]